MTKALQKEETTEAANANDEAIAKLENQARKSDKAWQESIDFAKERLSEAEREGHGVLIFSFTGEGAGRTRAGLSHMDMANAVMNLFEDLPTEMQFLVFGAIKGVLKI